MFSKFSTVRASSLYLGSKVLQRGKRTVRQAPGASRVINMLSVLSARKKQPRRLKLSTEDLIRHQTVKAAWGIYQKTEQEERKQRLRIQYERIKEACSELESLDSQLFAAANQRPDDKRFPIELRVPTDTPPRTAWDSEWVPVDHK